MPIHNLMFDYRLECIQMFLNRVFVIDDQYTRDFDRGYTGDSEGDCRA